MSAVETVKLGPLTVPRIINGLWQLSSPGTATLLLVMSIY